MNEFYTDYAEYLDRFFPGRKVQKISVNTGAGCPNRDGTIGRGGCIYCNNRSFTPPYCFDKTDLMDQIEAGKNFFRRKYKEMLFLVYFQSYTGTHNADIEALTRNYQTAMETEGVGGIVVSTRPDSLPDEVLGLLKELNREKPVFVEIGVETLHDRTLRTINRGHDSSQALATIERLGKAGLHTGVHLIAGLPGENEEMMLDTIKRVSATDVESIKMHHLQVLKNTPLHTKILNNELKIIPWELEDYLDFCVKAVDIIPRRTAIERFLASSPPEMVVAPKWGIKNYEFTNLLLNKLRKR